MAEYSIDLFKIAKLFDLLPNKCYRYKSEVRHYIVAG